MPEYSNMDNRRRFGRLVRIYEVHFCPIQCWCQNLNLHNQDWAYIIELRGGDKGLYPWHSSELIGQAEFQPCHSVGYLLAIGVGCVQTVGSRGGGRSASPIDMISHLLTGVMIGQVVSGIWRPGSWQHCKLQLTGQWLRFTGTGSASLLQTLELYSIPFPALPELLLSETDLVVHLSIWAYTGYISPEVMGYMFYCVGLPQARILCHQISIPDFLPQLKNLTSNFSGMCSPSHY